MTSVDKEALRESETRYRSLFDNMPNGLALCRMHYEQGRPRDFTYLQVNAAFEKLTGLKNVVGKKATEVIPGIREADPGLFEIYGRVALSGAPERFEMYVESLRMWFAISVYCPARDHFVAVFDVISERKQATKRIHELNLLLRAIRGIGRLIVREREPKQLLAKACEILVQTRGYVFAWVGMAEPDSKRIVPSGKAGKGAGYLDATTMTWDETPTGLGPTGTAMRTGQPWVCQDTATDPRFAPWKALALERGFASVAAVPMMQGARVLGALTVYSDRTKAFVEEEIVLLNELAADLAFALQSIEAEDARKRAAEALRLAHERFQRFVDSNVVGIVIANAAGNILEANDYYLRLIGFTRDELGRGKVDWRAITPPEWLPADEQAIRELHERGVCRPYEKEYARRDGTRISVFLADTLLPGPDEQIAAFVLDLTERKQAEEALLALSSRQEAILAAVPDIIMEVDNHKVYAWANRAGLDFFGDDVIGKEAASYFEGEQGTYQSVQPLFNGQQEAILVESWQRRKDGEKRLLAWRCRVLRDEGGNVTGALSSARDITEHKQIEAQLRQAQKMDAVGQLASGVAHDFSNMLAVIRGNADLLLMEAGQFSATANECLKHIVGASERAADLSRRLLVFSRKQLQQPQAVALNDLIRNFTKMLDRVIREDIELECHYAEELPGVQADPGMLEQVLLNLVVNARDAMPQGGHLRIATRRVSLGAPRATAAPGARAGEFVCLSVSDSGTGIAPEHLPRIFEPFFTTKEPGKGTGLGLATVYGIVQQHQGWIEVSSRPGSGTRFDIFLPVVSAPNQPKDAPEAEANPRGGNECILLVEDDQILLELTQRLLEGAGYQVWSADSAERGLELWRGHASEAALLLADLVTPGTLTGRQLAERLQKEKPRLRVVFMSGYNPGLDDGKTDFVGRLNAHFLQKPCPARILLQTVRSCLDENAKPKSS